MVVQRRCCGVCPVGIVEGIGTTTGVLALFAVNRGAAGRGFVQFGPSGGGQRRRCQGDTWSIRALYRFGFVGHAIPHLGLHRQQQGARVGHDQCEMGVLSTQPRLCVVHKL